MELFKQTQQQKQQKQHGKTTQQSIDRCLNISVNCIDSFCSANAGRSSLTRKARGSRVCVIVVIVIGIVIVVIVVLLLLLFIVIVNNNLVLLVVTRCFMVVEKDHL